MDVIPDNVRAFFSRLIAPLKTRYLRFVDKVVEHPILFIPAILVYLVITVLNILLILAIFFALKPSALFDQREFGGLSFAVLATCLTFSLMALWADYLFLGIRCFIPIAGFNGYGRPILRVVQLVLITVIIFAGVHYYIALFATKPAYHGIEPLTEFELENLPVMWRLFHAPSWDTVVNCLYFSTVTMATVGYGDVYPLTMYAKLATILQIMVSFALIVVILGWAIGNAKELAARAPATDSKTWRPDVHPPNL